jgi:hypothetical protein
VSPVSGSGNLKSSPDNGSIQAPSLTRRTAGAKCVEQSDDNLGAVDVVLTDKDLRVFDGISAIPAEYPGWMHSFWSQPRTAQLAASCG